MKAKEWIRLYGLEHYARYNLKKRGKRGRELDFELVQEYRKKYGADIPLKSPKRYYYAVWDIWYSYVAYKPTGEPVLFKIENVKSPLRRWEDLRDNRKEELHKNLGATFQDLIRRKKIPSGAKLEKAKLKKIVHITQPSEADTKFEEELKEKYEKKVEKKKKPEVKPVQKELEIKPELKLKEKKPEEKKEKVIDKELRERELALEEQKIELERRKLELQERKLKMAEEFLRRGYTPREIKELLDVLI